MPRESPPSAIRFRRAVLAILIGLACRASALAQSQNAGQTTAPGELLVLNSGPLTLHLRLVPEGGVLLQSLRRRTEEYDWASPGSPWGGNCRSELLNFQGWPPEVGFEHTGYVRQAAARGGTEHRIRLEHRAAKLQATLCVTTFPDLPFVDLCLRLQNQGDTPLRDLSRLDPLSFVLPERAKPYRAHWVTRNSYALRQAEVSDGLTVDGGNWNGPQAAGWLALEDPEHGAFLVAGVEWERHWSFDFEREESGRGWRFSAGLRRACTQDLAPGAVTESPHIFLGLASGDLDDAANAARDYLRAHVLPPVLPGFPFVSYNIWSTEMSGVEARLLEEAHFAAERLGVEVFYHDAGWYRDSDIANQERWGIGLGSYHEDRRKFPNGLRHLSDAVHGLGMKFGLWVCPEMVDVTIREREGIPGEWFTAARGQTNVQNMPGWNPMQMLCLGSPDVERHVQQQLFRITEEFKLDWLKWDASGLPGLDIVCDRTDHGHPPGNGSEQAVRGKYRILDALHQAYPNLVLEQCSYGTRLDYGMGRHGARVNWLSDSTAPSSHVRENAMAAAYVLPSAFNMTWIMRDDEVTRPQTSPFLDTMLRSRMMGSFGFGTLHGSLTERVSLYPPNVIEAARRNVRAYKGYRHLLIENAYHLTPWGQTNSWQVMEFAKRDQQEAVVFLFRNGLPHTEGRFNLRGLSPSTEYDVLRLNTGAREVLGGTALLHTGVKVRLTQDLQESEILQLKARPDRVRAGP